jgi:uncharacterized paraquat-inducible protein A
MDKNFLKQAIEQSKIRSLESTKKAFPSIPKMVSNLGNDVVKTVQSVASGQPLKSDETEANHRRTICNSCEFFNKSQERCTKCGCFMAVKVYLKAANCPIGKW